MCLTCTFRASCYSTRLSWALLLANDSPINQTGTDGSGRKRTSSRCSIRAEGALPPGWVTMITKIRWGAIEFAQLLKRRIIFKI